MQLNYDLDESNKKKVENGNIEDLHEGLLKKEQDIEDLKHLINKHENQIKLLTNQLDLNKKSFHDLETTKSQENDQLLQENTLLSHNLKDIKTELKEKEKNW